MRRWHKILAVVGAILASSYLARADLMDGAMVVARNVSTPNVQTATYQVSDTDCFRSMVQMAPIGSVTVTLPPAANFPNGCIITIKNSNTSRAQLTSGFPSDLPLCGQTSGGSFCLFPSQAVTVGIVSGAWATLHAPGRWKALAGGVQMFVATGGSDTANDGLTSGSPFATITHALNIAQNNIDFSGGATTASINLASGTYNECITWTGPQVGAEDITIVGNTSAPGSYVINCSNNAAVFLRDQAIMTLNGVTLVTGQAGQYAAVVSQFSTLDINAVNISGNATGGGIQVSELATVNHTGGTIQVVASVVNFISVAQGSQINLGNVTVGGSFTVGTFIYATQGGSVLEVAGSTITNNGTVTSMCTITVNAWVVRSSVTFPGSVCTPNTGGQLL